MTHVSVPRGKGTAFVGFATEEAMQSALGYDSTETEKRTVALLFVCFSFFLCVCVLNCAFGGGGGVVICFVCLFWQCLRCRWFLSSSAL